MIKIFDFDGTLADLWPRYHAVFCELAGADFPMKDYIKIKKRVARDEMVAACFGISLPDKYFEKKSVLLEEREYLSLDKLLFSVEEIKQMTEGKSLILSKRRNRENFKWELSELGIGCEFEVIESESKADWVSRHVNEPVIAVGDSVDDLKIGNLPNTEIHMVGYGLGTKSEFDRTGITYHFHEKTEELYNELGGKTNAIQRS